MRDLERLRAEIDILKKSYDDVMYDEAAFSWVALSKIPLPLAVKPPETSLLIFVPENYPNESIKEFYVDRGLLVKKHNEWVSPAHVFKDSYKPVRDWAYLCMEPRSWSTRDTLLTAIEMVYAFFSSS